MDKKMLVINKKTISESKSFEVTSDIIVPDIKPDIVSLVNTNGNAYIYKVDIASGKIRFDGNADLRLVYLAESGETRVIETTLNFAENIENQNISESSIVKERILLNSIEAKVLNERKISIKASLKLSLDVCEKVTIEIPDGFGEEEKNIKLKKETLEIKSIVGINKVRTTIKEDVSSDSNTKISELLKVDLEVTNIENKISYNKVLAKADSNVKILYLTEDGKIKTVESKIPIMSFIDIENVNDSHSCQAEYTIRNMLFKVNGTDSQSINIQVDFEVNCEVSENKTIDVIQDMYGIKKSIEFTKKEIEVEINSVSNEETVEINERVLLEDVLNIHDLSISPKVISISKATGVYNYECELSMDFYYEADNRNGLVVKNIKLPFMMKFEDENQNIDFNCKAKEFTVRDENVDLNIKISACLPSHNMKTINIIEDVQVGEVEEESDYKMFMYFVKQGDTIWEIAKKFRVCMEDIIKLNSLENPDRINIGDALYIMR